MGDTLAARRARVIQNAAVCRPPSTVIPCAEGGGHGDAHSGTVGVNQLNLNTSATVTCAGATGTTLVDHDQIQHAEWKNEALAKAQRYWFPA